MEKYKKIIKPIVYILSIVLILGCLIGLSQIDNFKKFVSGIEDRTFDLRQNIIYKYKKHNENIVIFTIDDISYEYLTKKYGAWPIPREYWAHLINETEKYNPKVITFDTLFVSKFHSQQESDAKLIKTLGIYDNVVVALDFDNYSEADRPSPEFPDAIKTKIKNADLLRKSPYVTYYNSRGIMKEIFDATNNIGIVDVIRDDDGTIRRYNPFFIYKDEFYKQLTLIVALKVLGVDGKNFEIKNNKIALNNTHEIPLNSDGRVILNWYGPNQTFEYIPLYKIEEAIKTGDTKFLNTAIKDKIIYVGGTTTALSDIKTTPTARHYPGVETHATFLNNILDNNLIKRTNFTVDILVALFLSAIVYLIIVKNKSVLLALIEFLLVLAGYFIFSVLIMHICNIWVGFVLPTALAIAVYGVTYILKYILKSKDYEQTYKLAVTDALTDMYNHRYFQEQMIANCENSARYEASFSLILIDIDFFKKFNDTFGHQSGDAVLKQVAQVIKKSIRATDIACRYGGEEMAVILTNTGKDEAIVTAEKICNTIRNHEFILANGQKTNVTISLGVSTAPMNGKVPVELIEYADKCLYRAKEQGRNQVVSAAN